MSFGKAPEFTQDGIDLLQKALSGECDIQYTKIQLGDGEYSGAILEKTDLTNPLVTITDEKLSLRRYDDYSTISGAFSNTGISTGFFWREIGLFAVDPNKGEILLCYQNAGELAEYISAEGTEVIEKNINIVLMVSSQVNMSVILGSSLVYATQSDIDTAIHNHTTDPDAHALLLANKLDVDGDGVEVYVTFEETTARAALESQDTLSTLFGKIKKWLSSLGTAAFKNVGTGANDVSAGEHTHNLTNLNGILPIVNGGTGANTAAAARGNLGAAAASVARGVTLLSSNWTGTSAPYSQIVNVAGLTASQNAFISLAQSINVEQMTAASNATLHPTGQGTNQMTISAFGDKPTVDIPITVIMLG